MTQVVNPSTREPGDLGQGPPCRHWIGVDRRYCGATERVRLYLTGPCCEDDAQAVKVELQDINLDGLWEFYPLRSMVPTSGTVSCG